MSNIPYQARLFGMFHIEYQGKELSLPGTASGRNLLAYLLLYRQRPHPRLTLAGQFWPESSESRARRALSQAIWQMNQHLPSIIQTDSNTVRISSEFPIEVDVATFEALTGPHLQEQASLQTAISDLSQATEYYRGDLLLDCYDDWVLVERERLRECYLQALERLVIAYKATGCFEEGLRVALQLVACDPLRERTHREVMRLYHSLERPEAALHQFEVCSTLLQDELGLEPEAESIALAQTIARRSDLTLAPYLPQSPNPVAPGFLDGTSTVQLPLIGRATERGELLRLIDPLHRGYGGIIFLEGEAGVGKTRLLQEVARDAEWRGSQVLWGKATELEGNLLYTPLIEALESGLSPLRCEQLRGLLQPLWLQVLQPFLPTLTGDLAGLPPLPFLEGTHGQNRLVEACTQLLTAWAQVKPLLLIIEDLQWASNDLLNVILHLAPALSNIGVFIIGSYRSEELRTHPELWEKLKALPPSDLRGRLVLKGLNATDSGKLIRTGLGTRKALPQFEKRLHKETSGNPLFLLETLRSLHDEGQLVTEDGNKWSLADDDTSSTHLPLPTAVELVIARRLAPLSADLRHLLSILAILGSRFDFSLLTALEVADTSHLLAVLNELVRRHLLVETDEKYRFSHDKINQVVYESIAEDERIHLHSHVAQKIEIIHPDWVETLAHHFTHGQLWSQALHYHKLAAEQAKLENAYSTVVKHLSAALDAAEQTASSLATCFDLLAEREAMLDIIGDRSGQEADLEAMHQLSRDAPQHLGLIYQRQALLLAQSSQFDEAEATARKAVQLAKDCSDESSQAAGLISLGKSLLHRGEPDRAIIYLREAVEIYQRQADTYQEAKARATLAMALEFNQIEEALKEAQKALTLYEKVGDLCGQAQVSNTLGRICSENNDLAQEYHTHALEIARSIGYRHEEARALGSLGNFCLGSNSQVSMALQHYEQALDIFRAIGNRYAENALRLNIASIKFSNLGENEAARVDTEATLAYAIEAGDSYIKTGSLGLLGLIACIEQDFPSARHYLHEGLTCAIENGLDHLVGTDYVYLVGLALDEGDPETAMKYLDEGQAFCQEAGLISSGNHLLALRGLALLALNQPQAALEATREAVTNTEAGTDSRSAIFYRHFQVLSTLNRAEEAQSAIEKAYQELMDELAGLTPEQRQTSLKQVRMNSNISEAWQAIQPHQASLRLPHASAPVGRPLRDDEWVEVTWTLSIPEDKNISNKATRRRKRLLRLLQEAAAQNAAPTYEHLAEALQVSLRTIGNDMAILRKEYGELPPTRHSKSH